MKQHSRLSKNTTSIFCQSILLLFLASCGSDKPIYSEFTFNGATMGTSYHVVLAGGPLDIQMRSIISSRVDSFLISYNHT
ncbi:MAG: hypothetical protein L3J79_03700, partial [Candidatus Marinimicrobia bacterium]|nr:hypothetical protein [Candidatus Neomarinimicrobiota bacterium]